MQTTLYYRQKTLKIPQEKILALMNEFSKVVEYKNNIQKLVALLYADNEISERVKINAF